MDATQKGNYADPMSPIASSPKLPKHIRRRRAPLQSPARPTSKNVLEPGIENGDNVGDKYAVRLPEEEEDCAIMSPPSKAKSTKRRVESSPDQELEIGRWEVRREPRDLDTSESSSSSGGVGCLDESEDDDVDHDRVKLSSVVEENQTGVTGGGEGEEGQSWTTSVVTNLFSPVLKFFKDEDGTEVQVGTDGVLLNESQARAAAAADAERVREQALVRAAEEEEQRVEAARVRLEEEAQAEAQARLEQTTGGTDVDGDVAMEEGEEEQWEEVAFDPFLFMKRLPAYDTVAALGPVGAQLPSKAADAPRPTLVLDLDETLVHCSVDPVENADLTFPVHFNGCDYKVNVRKRPHLDYFLHKAAEVFEVIVFTASQRVYAESLLDILDPEKKLIDHRLYRDSCLPVDGNFLKDLNVLGRDLSTTVIVDNSPHAFGYQIDNGIPIESWFDDDADSELLKLLPFLHSLSSLSDVRPAVRRQFELYALVEQA